VVDNFEEANEEIRTETLALQAQQVRMLEVESVLLHLVVEDTLGQAQLLEDAVDAADAGFAALDDSTLTEEGTLVAEAQAHWQLARPTVLDIPADPAGGSPRLEAAESDLHAAVDALAAAAELSAEDAQDELAAAQNHQRRVVAGEAIALVVGAVLFLVAGRWVVATTLNPLKDLAAAAGALQRGELSARAPTTRVEELQEVTAAFNAMAAAIEHSHRTLTKEAQTDPLTGLSNRAVAFEHLDNIVGRRHEDDGYAVVIVDLDRFKEINDTHGHLHGDLVLQHVSDRLRQTVRRSDIVSRLGGDEFLVILHGTSTDTAATVERIASVVNTPIEVAGSTHEVRASVGAASSADDRPPRVLVERADQAMYHAKGARLSGPCFWEDLQGDADAGSGD
tara:strand:- start:44 stop:1225 length:1182 start_codon:yes stop_codon:yes gene_type:complete